MRLKIKQNTEECQLWQRNSQPFSECKGIWEDLLQLAFLRSAPFFNHIQHNYYNARIHFLSAKFRFGPSRSTYNFIHKKVPIVTNPLKYLCTQKMAAHIVLNMLDAIKKWCRTQKCQSWQILSNTFAQKKNGCVKNGAERKNASCNKSSQIALLPENDCI